MKQRIRRYRHSQYKPDRKTNLSVEQLENRVVLAVTSSVANGLLTVTSNAADAISITSSSGNLKVNGADPDTGTATSSSITGIQVTGGAGANSVDLSGVLSAAFTSLSN